MVLSIDVERERISLGIKQLEGDPFNTFVATHEKGALVTGTVKSVDGDTVTVTVGNRDVKVKLNDKTQLFKSVAGTRTELAAGAHVMITPEGSAGGGGTGSVGGGDNLNAASVTILPSQ